MVVNTETGEPEMVNDMLLGDDDLIGETDRIHGVYMESGRRK